AARDGLRLKAIGSGHSFTAIAVPDGVAVRAPSDPALLQVDATGLATVPAGMTLRALSPLLWAHGRALPNLGDIDAQTVAGAISTGTHGTGATYANISSRVEAVELVLADGSVRELTAAGEPELLRAARVGVGALGAISAVTLRCFPAFVLERVDAPRPCEEVLGRFEELAEANDHFEFFTFPYSDRALVLERNRVDSPPRPRGGVATFLNDIVLENWALEVFAATGKALPRTIPSLSRLAGVLASGSRTVDHSHRVFVNERRVRFTEMEYAVPLEHGPTAVRRVIDWIRRNRFPVFFPIEVRVTAADDAHLSTAHERPTAYIAVHQYRGMEWRPYFEAVESIMDDYEGRPHWGKRHFQTAATLAPRYPKWEAFQAARDELDPKRAFTNEYAARVLGN
ncbi:MAG TPA: D-arabinono-1,4-lactone oxidase, partial [Solirubrobacterales bacterium]|nr:D-arabinono-1,4-lactone oxidase [Solirubrobacterales bacterium]